MIYDTIAAIATPFGTSGLSIIRISGDEAIEKAAAIFKGKNLIKAKSHTVTYGHIIDHHKKVIDEVLVTVFKAPKTFTKEDVVEISCHGGILVTQKVLERILEQGIRLAEPGEFTKRAFINGRIDLAQSEAIMDLIHAKNVNAMKLAVSGLKGDLSKLINELREELLFLIAQIEVNIDYPEYDDATQMSVELIKPHVLNLIKKLNTLLDDANKGKLIRDGVKTAIVGKPNVGKSSLLNALLNEERAIVTDIEGTTRDTIEAQINIGGITLILMDTAGIRETKDIVEQIGVKRSKKAIDEAELIILVLDQSRQLSKEDLELLEQTKNKRRIVVGNKNDLTKAIDLDIHMLSLSALNRQGLSDLEHEITTTLGITDLEEKDFNYLSNVRHINKIKEAISSMNEVVNAIDLGLPIDMAEIDLKKAWQYLGEITGDYHPEDLLNELFSKFCLGK
ncbi:tRNA modification GTPase MnmE [Paracholeplasma brassicae]|uniref:tRNA modification GTPase MnmE n=1 Tax=Acholeplasma brassicae TaxID=61635 RepID=U4KQ59_9MOLU|nr:tRNA uridine-5-carboxymethylaminomethyl(34) synthesis GTPase MnmE [Paracholeplasma brassicae]CCV66672.1 tRNA modification GTPase MnmE [Paracholeplasma brassicae]